MTRSLRRYWPVTGRLAEGRQQTGALLQMDGLSEHPELEIEVLLVDATFAHEQGDDDTAQARVARALDVSRRMDETDPEKARLRLIRLLHRQGSFAIARGDFRGANPSTRESRYPSSSPIVSERRLGRRRRMRTWELMATRTGDYPRALSLHRKSLAIWRRLGEQPSEPWMHENLGRLYLHRGNLSRAHHEIEASLRGRCRPGTCTPSDTPGSCSHWSSSPSWLSRRIPAGGSGSPPPQQGIATSTASDARPTGRRRLIAESEGGAGIRRGQPRKRHDRGPGDTAGAGHRLRTARSPVLTHSHSDRGRKWETLLPTRSRRHTAVCTRCKSLKTVPFQPQSGRDISLQWGFIRGF